MGLADDDVVDFGNKHQFALVYLLFKKLAEKFEFQKKDRNKWRSIAFIKGLNKFYEGLSNDVKYKHVAEFKIIDATVKNIVWKLKDDKTERTAYQDRNRIKISPTMNRICYPVVWKDEPIVARSWDKFLELNWDEAIRTWNSGVLRNAFEGSQIKILLSLKSDSDSNESKKLVEKLLEGMHERYGGSIELNFVSTEDYFFGEREAERRAVQAKADLVIYGSFDVDENSEVLMKINYFIKRLVKPHTRRPPISQAANWEITSSNLIRQGHLPPKIDQAISMILALKSYLELDNSQAMDFLDNIPTDIRCDEAWFMLGVCHYEKGNLDRARACWNSALGKNPDHNKSFINLAVLKARDFVQAKSESKKNAIKEEMIEMLDGASLEEAPSQVKFMLAQIYELIKESELASKYYTALANVLDFPGRGEVFAILGVLNGDPEHFRKAAGLSQDPATHTQISRLIKESVKMDKKSKVSLLQGIVEDFSNDDSIRETYQEALDLLSMPNGSAKVLATNGASVANLETKIPVNVGTRLQLDDVLEAGALREAIIFLLVKEENVFQLRRLKLAQGQAGFVGESAGYLGAVREVVPITSRLMLSSISLTNLQSVDVDLIQIEHAIDGRVVNVNKSSRGEFLMKRRHLAKWATIGVPIPVLIKYIDSDRNVVAVTNINLIFVNNVALKEEIGNIGQYFPSHDKEAYFTAIANYLSDLYAHTEMEDLRRWLRGKMLV